ncbi:polysaccharide lyase [Botryobacter ruber]|uniref:polysaccharide lyase n=1 Tax=Botryobacter ruber TaxID=2171629 RepID=UPI0013E3503A|nr:polysaccharide lyase [Botryobacter ruber]
MTPNAAITAQSTNAATTANLLYEETFEGSSYFPLSGSTLNKTHNIENCETDWTLSSVSSPVFQGSKAARFEIRQGQPLVGSGEKIRSEVTIIKGTEDSRFTKDIWYSFAVYFPSVGFEADSERDCLNQWYEDGSDETTIRAQDDKVFLEVTPKEGSSSLLKYDLFSSNPGSTSHSSFNNIPKNQWNEFTFHFIHSEGSDGLIEVFRNGVKIHHITGRNMHLEYPKWKVGLYKSSFLDGSSKHQSRVVYFDNIRVGKTAATLVDMISGEATGSNTGSTTETEVGTTTDTEVGTTTETETGTTTETETGTTTETETGTTTETETEVGTTTETGTGTTTETETGTSTGSTTTGAQVVSFTLIDASKDREIMTITNGAVIDLKKLDVDKINIRANTNGSAVVEFKLSGEESDYRVDDVAPYALAGDDRNGNYYSWSPDEGDYTLQATPRAGTKKDMGAPTGPTYKINFKIVD